jgi:hypothetical protein
MTEKQGLGIQETERRPYVVSEQEQEQREKT